MKEKLIQLIAEAEVMSLTITGTANYILAEVRCDTCSWSRTHSDVRYIECLNLRTIFRPTDFCSRWETK